MTITYHRTLVQGTPEWLSARTGILTASEMKHIITPAKLQYSNSEKERAHLYELAAQRINNYVEPQYWSDAMLRGQSDEPFAKEYYAKHYAPVEDCGFITNDKWGFTLGYSPDALVGSDGLIEIKSRVQKYQFETIISGEVPTEYMLQLQTGLLVSGRAWIDFISYCGGMHLFVKRVLPDEKIQAAIIEAATTFHQKLERTIADYKTKTASLILTERRIEPEGDIIL
jgi:predicted phage-related endonuclease